MYICPPGIYTRRFSVRSVGGGSSGLLAAGAAEADLDWAAKSSTSVPVRAALSVQRHAWLQTGVLQRQPNQAQSDDGEENLHKAIRRMNNLRFVSSHMSFPLVKATSWYKVASIADHRT